MSQTLGIVLFSGLLWFPLGVLFGRAHARALRAWKDYRATVLAIRGLFTQAVYQWRLVAKVVGITALVVVVGMVAVLHG